MLAAVGFAIAATVVLLAVPALVPEGDAELGTHAYVSGQRQLRGAEVLVHISVLRNGIQASRPAAELLLQLELVERDLAWALEGASGQAGDRWTELMPALAALRRQIRQGDPQAAEAVVGIQEALSEALGGR